MPGRRDGADDVRAGRRADRLLPHTGSRHERRDDYEHRHVDHHRHEDDKDYKHDKRDERDGRKRNRLSDIAGLFGGGED